MTPETPIQQIKTQHASPDLIIKSTSFEYRFTQKSSEMGTKLQGQNIYKHEITLNPESMRKYQVKRIKGRTWRFSEE